MVKKRQRDLDSGTLLGKASVVLSDLRAPKKFTKKSRNSDQLKHAARNLLSGRARPQPTAEDTSEEPLFLLKTVKQTVPKLNEKKAKSKKKSQKHNEPVSVTKSSTIPQTISSKSKEDNSEGEPVSAAPHPILLDESESTAGVTPPQSSGIQEALKSLASSGGYVQDEEEMEEEEIIQHQAVWQVGDRTWLVAFTSRLEVRGTVLLKNRSGPGCPVAVHGFTLNDNEETEAYSPAGYLNTVIEALPGRDCAVPRMVVLKSYNNLRITDFCARHPNARLVTINLLSTSALDLCMKLLPASTSKRGMLELGPSLLISCEQIPAKYSSTCLQAINHLVKLAQRGDELRVVVCGASNMGKSTLLKYLLNRLLSCQKSIHHLECDPGQSEFTPSGCVTLRRETTPLIGPAWCHPRVPDYCHLIGGLSADADPDRYVLSVDDLVSKYKQAENRSALVVSTMGWKQGLGLHFLAATIQSVRPTHLIQLSKEGISYSNFAEFSVFQVLEHNLFLQGKETEIMTLEYELMPIIMDHLEESTMRSVCSEQSCDHNPKYIRPDFLCFIDVDRMIPSRTSRELMMMSYLSQCLGPNARLLNDVTPYRVSWRDVAIDCGLEDVPREEIISTVNASMVALCTIPSERIVSVDETSPLKLLSHPSPLSCIGFGLVRAVDVETRSLYIITPVDVSGVNLLVKLQGGAVPAAIFTLQLGQVYDDSPIPYVDEKVFGLGTISKTDVKKMYKKIVGRKSLSRR